VDADVLTLQLDRNLRTRFNAAAEREHRLPEQVLLDFVRDYVERADERTRRISPEERQSRQDAVNYARASVELEGFKVSQAEEDHAERYINGEIDIKEFIRVRHG